MCPYNEEQRRKSRCGGVGCDGWSEGRWQNLASLLPRCEEVAITATCFLDRSCSPRPTTNLTRDYDAMKQHERSTFDNHASMEETALIRFHLSCRPQNHHSPFGLLTLRPSWRLPQAHLPRTRFTFSYCHESRRLRSQCTFKVRSSTSPFHSQMKSMSASHVSQGVLLCKQAIAYLIFQCNATRSGTVS
jgi:hypothetical protein